jgi:hypothetical protein
MNTTVQQLADNLLMSAKIALGAKGSTPSPQDRQRLFDAVCAIENACVKNGKFKWKNAGCAK